MLKEPQFSEVNNNRYLELGSRINIKELLGLDESVKFLFNATNYPPESLTISLLNSLISLGGVKFFTTIFDKNIYLAMRMTTRIDKLLLAKAIEKYWEYNENPDLRLLFFYLSFYIKTKGIDLETLTIIQPDYVLSFEEWKQKLTADEIDQIQTPGELWEGLDLIGLRIKKPDRDKGSRSRARAISLFETITETE